MDVLLFGCNFSGYGFYWGGLKKLWVFFHHFFSKLYNILYPLSRGVTTTPKFKILWSIVIPYSVLVMHSFVVGKKPSKDLLHNKDVLQNIGAPLSPLWVLWGGYPDIPIRIIYSSSLPKSALSPNPASS